MLVGDSLHTCTQAFLADRLGGFPSDFLGANVSTVVEEAARNVFAVVQGELHRFDALVEGGSYSAGSLGLRSYAFSLEVALWQASEAVHLVLGRKHAKQLQVETAPGGAPYRFAPAAR